MFDCVILLIALNLITLSGTDCTYFESLFTQIFLLILSVRDCAILPFTHVYTHPTQTHTPSHTHPPSHTHFNSHKNKSIKVSFCCRQVHGHLDNYWSKKSFIYFLNFTFRSIVIIRHGGLFSWYQWKPRPRLFKWFRKID